MLAKTVQCPLCGGTATLTLFEQPDVVRGTEGRHIEFECSVPSHILTDVGMLRLWAADHSRDAAADIA